MNQSIYYHKCLICGRILEDYKPDYCCNGMDCACMGQPVNPCVCSDECDNALYKYIGLEFEERRIKAGIKKADNSKYLIQSFSP